MKFRQISLLLALPFYLISCSTQHKMPYYLETLTDTTGTNEVKIPELRIQKNDLLSIQVFSSSTMPEKSDVLYNLPSQGGSGAATGGFLVDANGDIEFPRLGSFHVEGLTKQELAMQIKKRLTVPDTLLINPNVIIRFLNFKVTILGPVTKEGVINVPGERLTILEAVGLAGGITDYGKKNSIKVIRELDGKRETGYIDLSSKDIFDSPYFNLVQNDVLIVEPTRQKTRMADQSVVAQKISFALGIITSAAFIYNIFK